MKPFSLMEHKGLIVSANKPANTIALPSIQKAKYLISLENKTVFFYGLNMLRSRSFKTILAKKVLTLMYRLGIINYLLKPHLIHLDKSSALLSLIWQNYKEIRGINIYLGIAKNQNFSITLQIINQNKEHYLRYPISASSKKYAANEYESIHFLQKKGLNPYIPQVDKIIEMDKENLYVYEGVSNYTIKNSLCANKMQLLQKLTSADYGQLKNNVFFQKWNSLIYSMLIQSKDILGANLVTIYEQNIESISCFFIKKAFFHGDYSPDNILITSKQFYLIDFEYSCNDFFSCFDLFHYVYKAKKLHQKIISLKEIKLIEACVKKTYGDHPFLSPIQINALDMLKQLFIFYLFLLLKRYLLDEQMDITNDVVNKLQKSILLLYSEKRASTC